MPILVDSNVLIDIATNDPKWGDWSASMVAKYLDTEVLKINPIIYAEISIGFKKIEEVEESFPQHLFIREPLPWEAAFLAGKAFLAYRKRKENRPTPLPDFYIGAHALVSGYSLLTRDARRYRTYFPKLNLIAPD